MYRFGFPLQLRESQLRGAVDGDEQVELALFGPDLGDVDVNVADGVAGEALLLGLGALDLGQAADAVPLEAAVQARPGQMRDRGLQAAEAVPRSGCAGRRAGSERQQGGPAKGDDDRLLLGREDGRADLLWPHLGVGGGLPLAPLLHGRGADAVTLGERSHALLTKLDRATDRLCRAGAAVKNLTHSAPLAA